MSLMRSARMLALLSLGSALAGCGSEETRRSEVARRSEVTPAGRRQVLSWLQCDECTNRELERVRVLGRARATASATLDSLREALLGGPPDVRRSNVRRQFESAYQEDSADAASEGEAPQLTRTEYVDPYLDNFVTVYRVRAARALAEIGGPTAKAILDSAVAGYVRTPGDSLRADAQRLVRFARDSILGAQPGYLGTADGPHPDSPGTADSPPEDSVLR